MSDFAQLYKKHLFIGLFYATLHIILYKTGGNAMLHFYYIIHIIIS